MKSSDNESLILRLAGEMEEAFRSGGQPDFQRKKTKFYVFACDWLLKHGRVAAGEYAIRHLHASYPKLDYAATMKSIFDCGPHGPAPILDFSDDPLADVQVVRRDGCDRLLIVFCGRRNRAGLPLSLIHPWLGRQPVSLVYLRDLSDLAGAVGYPSLGPDRQSSVIALKRLAEEMGARSIYTYGNSSGSFAALHYGLNLGAKATLCMAGPTNLTPGFNEVMTAFKAIISESFDKCPDYMIDLRSLYASTERPPQVLYVYGERFLNDRLWAQNMAGLPSVELVPIADYSGHNVVIPAVLSGSYPTLLQRLLTED